VPVWTLHGGAHRVVSVEETSTRVEVGFTTALKAEGCSRPSRHATTTTAASTSPSTTRPARSVCDKRTPYYVRVDPGVHGPVRDRPALRRPGTPTDRAGIESLNGHLRVEGPAPAGDPRPGHPARRAGHRAGALLKHGAVAVEALGCG
jgi:hypothetical protein